MLRKQNEGKTLEGKVDCEVVIGGKVYTLSGYESEEYLQKVASYINGKISEISQNAAYSRLPIDMQNILLNINVADDYFKAQGDAKLLEEDIDAKEKDLYNLKRELIAAQMKLENTEKAYKSLQAEKEEASRKIIQLETELKSAQKQQQDKLPAVVHA